MTNLWAFLLQTLSVALAGALVLAVKALLKDKLPPRWQYLVWSVLALRILLPVSTGGKYVLLPLPVWVETLKTWPSVDCPRPIPTFIRWWMWRAPSRG